MEDLKTWATDNWKWLVGGAAALGAGIYGYKQGWFSKLGLSPSTRGTILPFSRSTGCSCSGLGRYGRRPRRISRFRRR